MRDDDLTFVELVQRDLRDVRWAEPAELRARGRRRSRRTAAVATAVAALLVASATTVVAGGRSGGPTDTVVTGAGAGSPTSAPVASPAPSGRAEIPEAVLLEPRDLTLKTGARLGDVGLLEPVRVDGQLESCAHQQGIYLQSTVSRYSRSRVLLRPVAEASDGVPPVLSQDVYRVDPPWGMGLFGDIDRMVQVCPTWRTSSLLTLTGRTVSAETEHRWEPAVTGFAGDQSVMLRHVTGQARDRSGGKAVGPAASIDVTLVIRVGDLVTVIVPGPGTIEDRVDGSGPGLSYAQLESLGRVAARRLCGAANPGC
ncbi:hypothetical protein [Micromonospora chersina]|uniref:Uncharacterized protein n=1 Tax=Micromonospora chersina TaxID=47854 RepID=A0A1C6V4U2_9ACTN|nr:hypothetical protein [Micromonospora chersina]SCL61288.1 hypothetical protein GA0070603_3177 [Micromonospora chersina]